MISAAASHQDERLNPPSAPKITLGGLAPAGKAALPVVNTNPNKKKVLFVTSELADLVKTGGLGDVSAALPRAMRHLHDVRVLIPGYRQVLNSDNPIHIIGELSGHAALPPCKIGRMDLADGLVIYVLICPELYEREGSPYGANNGRDWPDNHIRFARLGLAAADIAANLAQIHWQPDLVHAHDWPAGLAPRLYALRGGHGQGKKLLLHLHPVIPDGNHAWQHGIGIELDGQRAAVFQIDHAVAVRLKVAR